MKHKPLPRSASLLLELYGVKGALTDEVWERWNEKHRHYHTMEHLEKLLDLIEASEAWKMHEKQQLALAAIFHDIVYDPTAPDNEAKSVAVMRQVLHNKRYINDAALDKIEAMIMATKDNNTLYEDPLVKFFVECDLYPLRLSGPSLLRYEQQVFKEFQFVAVPVYIEQRVRFLREMLVNPYLQHKHFANIEWLARYVEQRTYRVGVYAGSFDPFHTGHMNILEKAEAVFDKVVVAQARNPEKMHDATGTNVAALSAYLKGREMCQLEGLTTVFLDAYRAGLPNVEVTLVRGLRDASDLRYEQAQLRYMEDISGKPVRAALFVCDSKFSHVSSSAERTAFKVVGYGIHCAYDYKIPFSPHE